MGHAPPNTHDRTRFPLEGTASMKILNVTITVHDPATAAQFYRDTLQLPVKAMPDGAEVTIGHSQLTLTAGDRFDGVHHLAFGILPEEFDLAHQWLARRVPLLQADGSEVIPGSDDWGSRSLYFPGPEGIILEFIARNADAGIASIEGESPHMLSISEVGIGVDDVLDAAATLSRELGISHYYDLSNTFASMGSHDGLLILVDQDRTWYPTKTSTPARGPLTVHIETPARKSRVDLNPRTAIVSR